MCMLSKVASCFNRDPMQLYELLLRGKPVEFDLNADGVCCFKTTKTHRIITQTLSRKVCFPIAIDLMDFTP